MKDWRGVEVKRGSIVVYPVRLSSHQWMVEGIVIEVFPREGKRWNLNVRKMEPFEDGSVKVQRTLTSDMGASSDIAQDPEFGYVIKDTGRRYMIQLKNLTVVEP